jgi:hypothetical protein
MEHLPFSSMIFPPRTSIKCGDFPASHFLLQLLPEGKSHQVPVKIPFISHYISLNYEYVNILNPIEIPWKSHWNHMKSPCLPSSLRNFINSLVRASTQAPGTKERWGHRSVGLLREGSWGFPKFLNFDWGMIYIYCICRRFLKCGVPKSSWLFQYTKNGLMSLMTWMIWGSTILGKPQFCMKQTQVKYLFFLNM